AAKRRLGLDHVQISEDAVFALAQALEAQGLAWAESAFAALGEDNLERGRLRLDEIKRLSDTHVAEALDGDG
ncbi:MAG: hypothetical protein V3U70_00685, partial [Thermoplasmata archaeon]